jgi:demethylmenaquinone methyltransferase/2-methoxy-6-polyprenyl-1,4-benzoquinol methylase
MPLLDHFGILAPFYERFIPLRQVHELITRAGLPVTGWLLDAGGGTGRVAKGLEGLAGETVVADLSIGMLRQTQGWPRLTAVNSHAECLPFPAESFERVIMVDALHHVCSHAETAAELWRVLKPGGRIVIEEPDIGRLAVKAVAVAEKVALMRSHFISPDRIAGLFPYPQARVTIDRQGFNAWVMVDKLAT